MLDAVLKKNRDNGTGIHTQDCKWAITFTNEGRYTGVVPIRRQRTGVFKMPGS